MADQDSPPDFDDQELSGQLVVPILGANFDVDGSIVVQRYSIVPITDVLKNVFQTVRPVPEPDAAILQSATHAVVIDMVNAYTQGGRYELSVPDERALTATEHFFGVLALETPSPVNFAQLAFIETGRARTVDQYVSMTRRDYVVAIESFVWRTFEWPAIATTSAQRTLDRLLRLDQRHPRLRVAVRRLYSAQSRFKDEDRIVDLCISLEAILGSGFSETVHRLSMRAAAVLAYAGWAPSSETYKAIRDIYSYRSRVVHGDASAYKKDALTIDGSYIHASRYALAALHEILSFFLAEEEYDLDALDERLIFLALDIAPSAIAQYERTFAAQSDASCQSRDAEHHDSQDEESEGRKN